MAKGFDTLKVKSAVRQHNKFDLSMTHLTTMNFGEIVPLYSCETVPGDKFNIDSNFFSRMAPLAKPTYGKFSFKTVAGFVPYHQIAWDSDAWLAGKTTWEGQTPHNRYFTLDSVDSFVYNYCVTSTGANSGNCQYCRVKSDGTALYYIFTPIGKYWVKVLNSLGYSLPEGVDLQVGSSWQTTKSTKLSAYPLLAYFKLYNDYMSQSQRYNTSALSNILQCVKYGKSVTGYTPSTGAITHQLLKAMFDCLYLNYENDYFTSAWQSPNTSLATLESIDAGAVPGSSSNASAVVAGDFHDNTLELNVVQNPTDKVYLSQRALDFLKSFDDWVRRNSYSGSRAVQQIYSRFGIKTDDYRSHYANVLGTETMPIQVGDITSQADTKTNVLGQGLELGQYAGKGIMSGSKTVSCSVSDYGIILVFGYFTVTPMNSFGYDRMVLRTNPLDFYNPEFDGIGADAISVGELYSSPIAVGLTGYNSGVTENSVFGFTERYNAYRYGRDKITGEFRDYQNKLGGMNTWHTGRDLSAAREAGNLVAQSTTMNTLEQTGSQYDRIFNTNSSDIDKFYLTAHFKVSAVRPMLNLNQVVRLGEGDTVVPRNGNVIS